MLLLARHAAVLLVTCAALRRGRVTNGTRWGEGKLELQQGSIPAEQKRDDVLLQVKPASVCGSDMIKDDHGLTNHATGAVSCWVGFNPKST